MTMENYEYFKEEDSFQEHHADSNWPKANSHCPDPAGAVIRPPNLVQIGDLWICEDEDQVMPDKIEFALLIQCSSAEQCRAAMKAAKIEFTIFEHYSQNVEDRHPANE